MIKKILFWFPRVLLVAYVVFGGAYAITDSSAKGIDLSGVGMLAIFAVFVAGLGYIAWTAPKTGGPIILLIGIFTVIIALTYQKQVNWNSIYFNALPLIIAGGLLSLEGYKLTPAHK